MRKNTILLLFCILAGLAGLRAQGHEARLAALDVLHYRFELHVNDKSDTLRGVATLRCALKQAWNPIALDLVADQGEGGMHVSKVTLGGEPLEFMHEGEELVVQLPEGMDAGTPFELQVTYGGVPRDGLVISRHERDGRSFFGDNWPNRAHHWLPTVDHPSDKASVDFVVHAPAHYRIVANGKLVEQRVHPDGTQTSHWHNGEPLPTKVMVFGAADFAVKEAGEVQGIKVSSWVFQADEVPGFKDYAQGVGILEWFVQQLGPYPWDKLANVQSRTRYGGMENASCIFYHENSVKGDGSCEALMAHEIAHQWFGNSASEAVWNDVWLSEGFATYLTHVYFEQRHSLAAMQDRLRADRKSVVAWSRQSPFAIVDTRIPALEALLNPNSYEKASWVLHMLRHKVGDAAFFKGIKAYYARYQYGNATTADFRKAMEEASGASLEKFFEQWLYRHGQPKLNVEWSYKKGKKELRLKVTQVQPGESYEFPLEVAAVDAEGKELGRCKLDVSQKVTMGSVPLPQSPAKVVVDPDVRLLGEWE